MTVIYLSSHLVQLKCVVRWCILITILIWKSPKMWHHNSILSKQSSCFLNSLKLKNVCRHSENIFCKIIYLQTNSQKNSIIIIKKDSLHPDETFLFLDIFIILSTTISKHMEIVCMSCKKIYQAAFIRRKNWPQYQSIKVFISLKNMSCELHTDRIYLLCLRNFSGECVWKKPIDMLKMMLECKCNLKLDAHITDQKNHLRCEHEQNKSSYQIAKDNLHCFHHFSWLHIM